MNEENFELQPDGRVTTGGPDTAPARKEPGPSLFNLLLAIWIASIAVSGALGFALAYSEC